MAFGVKRKITEKRIRLALASAIPVLTAVLLAGQIFVSRVWAEEGYDQVAGSSAMGSVNEELASYGMTPVTGDFIEDGSYIVRTECSSSFFRIERAELTVKDGKMTAVLTMSSSSYSLVYPGTAEAAAAAPFEAYIPSVEIDTWNTFTIPVQALDTELDLAAFSKRKKKWYPRKILFHASDIPAGKLRFEYPDYERIAEALALYEETAAEGASGNASSGSAAPGTDGAAAGGGTASGRNGAAAGGGTASGRNGTAAGGSTASAKDGAAAGGGTASGRDGTAAGSGGLPREAAAVEEEDGTWSVEVTLAGGSGRASVTTPTWLIIQDGRAYARLLWSSSYYDYMILDGIKYLNETTDGSSSSFTIPIPVFDAPVEVIADTTAMGDPVEIAYTLTFYSDSVGSRSRIPQEAARRVLAGAGVFMAAGGLLNFLVKKRRAV